MYVCYSLPPMRNPKETKYARWPPKTFSNQIQERHARKQSPRSTINARINFSFKSQSINQSMTTTIRRHKINTLGPIPQPPRSTPRRKRTIHASIPASRLRVRKTLHVFSSVALTLAYIRIAWTKLLSIRVSWGDWRGGGRGKGDVSPHSTAIFVMWGRVWISTSLSFISRWGGGRGGRDFWECTCDFAQAFEGGRTSTVGFTGGSGWAGVFLFLPVRAILGRWVRHRGG